MNARTQISKSSKPKLHGWRWGLVAILLLSFGLSVRCLACESIWVDEGATIAAARGETTNIIPVLIAVIDNNPPLTYLIWHFWIKVTGLSEFSLRMLSVFAGLLTSVILYQLGRILFDRQVGMLSALMLISSGFHLYYAQTVRSNSLLELLALISFLLFVRLLAQNTFRNRAAYGVINVLLLYTHYYGIFILLAHTIFFTVQNWRTGPNRFWRQSLHWISTQAIIGTAFIPWLPMMLFQGRRATTEIQAPSFALAIGTFIEFTWSPVGFVLAVAIIGVGFYILLRPKLIQLISTRKSTRLTSQSRYTLQRSPAGFWLVSIWLISGVGAPLLISFLFKPIFLSRYAIAVLPAFYLLLAWLARRVIKQPLGLWLTGLLIAAQLTGVYALYQNTNNEQWREAVQYVDDQAKPGDLLLFYSGIGQYSFDYYSRRDDLTKYPLGLTTGSTQAQPAIRATPNTNVWLVLVYHSATEFETTLQSLGYKLTDQQTFFRIQINHYQKQISP